MEYQAKWIIEERILILIYHGIVTSEDVQRVAQSEVMPRLEAAEHPIHLLVDVSSLPSINISIRESVEDPRTDARFSHLMMGCIIYITENNFDYFHLLASFIGQRYGKTTRVCRTLADALAFLREADPTLPNEDNP